MALNKIKPLDDFLTGARTYNAVNKTTADEFVIHPADNFISCALAMGAPLGNWSTVKDHFADAGATLPVGARVIGSNGKVYQVGTATAGATDPTLGGAGWTDVAAGISNPATGTTPTTFSGDTLPDVTKVKVGDAWITGANPPPPHSKNSKYFWNGGAWRFEAGEAMTVARSGIANMVGEQKLAWTALVNDNSVTVSGDTITFNAAGGYEVYLQSMQGAYTWNGGAVDNQHYFGVGFEDSSGTIYSESNDTTSQSNNAGGVGTSMIVSIPIHDVPSAGQVMRIRAWSSGSLSNVYVLKIRRKW